MGTGRDRHKPGYGTGRSRNCSGTSIADPSISQDRKAARNAGKHRVEQNSRNIAVQRQFTAAIETEPADPEQEDAEDRRGGIVGFDGAPVLAKAAKARPDDDDRGECDPAPDAVHHGGPGKVHETHGFQPTRLRQVQTTPGPVAEQGIDQNADKSGDDEIAAEAHPLRHRAGDDGCRGTAERDLKEEEGNFLRDRLAA